MGAWSDIIQQGAYKGVAFDFISTRDEIGRVVDRQRIYGRPGARLVDKAPEPRAFDVMAIFVEEDYPTTMNKLIAKIEEGGIGEFVHPIYGSFRALVTHASIEHNAEDAIDSATMQLHVEEHSDATEGPKATRTSPAALANATRSKALAVLNAMTVYAGVTDAVIGNSAAATQKVAADVASVTTSATLASAAADQFEADGDTMSALEVQAAANASLSSANTSVASLGSCTTNGEPLPEQFDLVQAIMAMTAALTALANATIAGKPQLTTFVIVADIPLLAWAHARYRDSGRALELLALNPQIDDPLLLLAGTELVAYAQ